MSGACYFSKLDASSGFFQIVLDEKSTKLCTFNTPFGRHCFLRLPFGISSAPEVSHKTVQQLFDGIEGVGVFIDDVVVWGRTKEEHDAGLRRVLNQAQRTGLKLNKNKCHCVSVNYLGKFVPNLTANTRSLRTLLESKTEWQWKRDHVEEWLWLKSSLTKEPVLKFYDQDKPLKVSG